MDHLRIDLLRFAEVGIPFAEGRRMYESVKMLTMYGKEWLLKATVFFFVWRKGIVVQHGRNICFYPEETITTSVDSPAGRYFLGFVEVQRDVRQEM